MLSTILKFELKYWFKSIAFYVYASLFFALALLTMAGAAGIFGAGSSELQSANAPMRVYSFLLFFNKLLLFLLPAIIGSSLYKDYKNNVHSVLYSYPFTKTDYILGKFFSAFFIVLLIAFLVVLGLLLGTLLPGVNPAQLLEMDVSVFMRPFLLYLVPNLFLCGVLVFAVVAVTRNIYTGFITILLIMLLREVATRLTGGIYGGMSGLLIEPFGESATQYFTQNWTLAENNSLPSPIEPILIYNRLLWLAIATTVFVAVYRWFSFSQHAIVWRFKSKTAKRAAKYNFDNIRKIELPATGLNFTTAQRLKTAWRLAQTDFWQIVSSGAFLSILVAGTLFIIVLLLNTNPQTDTKILPVTWVILGLPVFFFSFLIQVLTFLYAGILVHRAQTVNMDALVHATPTPNWVFFLSKFIALVKMQLVLLLLIMVVGIGIQLYDGYYHIEIGHYLSDLFGIHLIGLVLWALVALFIQSLFTNPYLGLFILLMGYMGIGQLPSLRLESLVFRFNENPDAGFFMKYSDLNGHGHALGPYFLYKAYWSLFALFSACAALLFWQREHTQSFVERLKLAGTRWKGKLALSMVLLLIGFLGFGFFLYQAEQHPSNKQLSGAEQQKALQQFQTTYGKYSSTTQPRITNLFVKLDIYPQERSFEAAGHYTLINKSSQAIDTILVKAGYDEITRLTFSQEAREISTDSIFKFSVFALENGLAPGDSIRLSFNIKNKPNTCLVQNSNVLRNGSFIKSDIFPRLGYFAKEEKGMPSDSTTRFNHYQSIDADLIYFEAVVSTDPDQTALAPGYLIKEWEANSRRYFHYKMDKPIKFVLGFNSGNYDLFQEMYKDVDLRIYHHPQHTFCLPQMMEGLKGALDYNTANFSPYQHTQAQVIEFSKSEGSYATTAGNCIPTSEMRFINDARDAKAGYVDISFYVAAHELSHQWWGNQVLPADALGAIAITESITEYVTAKVYEKQYGKKSAAQFLQLQLNRYLKGRTTETQTEPPLMHVGPEQSYIAYGKGALAFYVLSEHIGEENLNRALKAFLEQAQKPQQSYITTIELLDFLKMETPDSKQHLIKDLFETADAEKIQVHFEQLKLLD